MRSLRVFLLCSLVFSLAACGDDGRGDSDASTSDASTSDTDTSDTGTTDSGATDSGTTDSGTTDSGTTDTGTTDSGTTDSGTPDGMTDTGMPDTMTMGDSASMVGNVTRTAAISPSGDGIGNLYVALFDIDPVQAMLTGGTPMLVGTALVEGADLSADDASVPYRMEDIPPRAEPYFVTAFLDDDLSITDPNDAGPDVGELISLNGFSSPQVSITSATEVTLDIVLNNRRPF